MSPPELPIRILLVEDEPAWQEGIRHLLAQDNRLQLTGVAADYPTALRLFQETAPQAVLLDWKIQGEQDGLAVGKALLGLGVASERIILISGSSPSSIPAHPFLYVPKNRIADDLLPLLISVTIN